MAWRGVTGCVWRGCRGYAGSRRVLLKLRHSLLGAEDLERHAASASSPAPRSTLALYVAVPLQGVLLQETLGAPGAGALRPSDLLAVLHLNNVTPALRLRNATVGSSSAMLGMWGMDESGTQSGSWVFINTELQWAPSELTAATASADRYGAAAQCACVAAVDLCAQHDERETGALLTSHILTCLAVAPTTARQRTWWQLPCLWPWAAQR